MGWSGGSELAECIWDAVKEELSPETAEKLARVIVVEFEKMDCDTMEEVAGPIGDIANRMHKERRGAPANAAEGDVWTDDRWDETYRFDGSRWQWCDEVSA